MHPMHVGKLFFAVALALSSVAQGYTIKNAAAPGCHEMISAQALRVVREQHQTAAPLPATINEQALIDDLQFTPALDMRDLGAVTLLLAVRDNDLKGRSSQDLTELAEIHGDPGDQVQHCLRGPDQKEPNGSAEAIRDCRAFIRGKVLEALDGLDANGAVNLQNRSILAVHLSVRGGIKASLPSFYVQIGPALHALQDSFTHTYRTTDGHQITVALNWIDYVNKQHVEAEDGPAHTSALDVCDDPDDLRKLRRELATIASTELLRAALDPNKTREEKMAAVDGVLDGYMGFKPGCTSDNQWCDAPETQYVAGSGCGCSAGTGLGALGALLGLWSLSRRRRSGALLGVVLFALPLVSAQAQTDAAQQPPAETAPAAAVPGETAPDAPVTTPVEEPLPANPSEVAWGGSIGAGAAFDQPALALTAGIRLRLTKHWSLGLDGEWNPWIAMNGTPIRNGAINVYVSGILRFPLSYQNFNLRSTLSLGGSYLLSELYGAPEGSMGIFFAISPLGLEWKASKYFYLIINPAGLAVPVPHLTGVPFFYPQYRLTLALEFYGS